MSIKIDRIDWAILNSLADSFQPLEQIVPSVKAIDPDACEELIKAKIEQFLEQGLICRESDVYFCKDYENWFGMTATGCEVWETHCAIFSYDPPDWSQSYTLQTSYATGEGYVCGLSKEICESIIAREIGESADIVIDPQSFKHRSIEEFQAKYYKKFKGGYCIDFRFTKKDALNKQGIGVNEIWSDFSFGVLLAYDLSIFEHFTRFNNRVLRLPS